MEYQAYTSNYLIVLLAILFVSLFILKVIFNIYDRSQEEN